MRKRTRHLTLSRETLLRLDETTLRKLDGGNVIVVGETKEPACYSPLCGPTFWKTCDTYTS